MTDISSDIVAPGTYSIRYSRDRTETVEVVRTRRIGRGYSVIFADNSHMKFKQFQRTATAITTIAEIAALTNEVYQRHNPTNGVDAPL